MDRNNRNVANGQSQKVALRKESVDRNVVSSGNRIIDIGRSPQGERG